VIHKHIQKTHGILGTDIIVESGWKLQRLMAIYPL
jgi:hypothetical protein